MTDTDTPQARGATTPKPTSPAGAALPGDHTSADTQACGVAGSQTAGATRFLPVTTLTASRPLQTDPGQEWLADTREAYAGVTYLDTPQAIIPPTPNAAAPAGVELPGDHTVGDTQTTSVAGNQTADATNENSTPSTRTSRPPQTDPGHLNRRYPKAGRRGRTHRPKGATPICQPPHCLTRTCP